MCALHTYTPMHTTFTMYSETVVVKSVNFTHMTSCPNQGLSQLLSERHTWLAPSVGYLHTVDVCDETVSVCVYACLQKLTNPAAEW